MDALVNLEAVVPGLAEVLNRERIARARVFSDIPWTVAGCELIHMTPRHRLELQMVGNSFFRGSYPTKADIFQFLWRLNPRFTRRAGSVRGWMAKRHVAKEVKRRTVLELAIEIQEFKETMLQDMPEATTGSGGSASKNAVHWLAAESYFYATHGLIPVKDYLDTPYLQLQQLFRAHRMTLDQDAQFINKSDQLVRDWHLSMMRQTRHESRN